ncbi:MAG: VOC family protein, partial [Acidimicrobiales bacterium]
MTDPFASLRRPAPAVDPDPAFAARLHRRVERALARPRGVTVSSLTLTPAVPGPRPRRRPATGPAPGVAVVPYL